MPRLRDHFSPRLAASPLSSNSGPRFGSNFKFATPNFATPNVGTPNVGTLSFSTPWKWLGREGSNLRCGVQSPESYLWTTPQ